MKQQVNCSILLILIFFSLEEKEVLNIFSINKTNYFYLDPSRNLANANKYCIDDIMRICTRPRQGRCKIPPGFNHLRLTDETWDRS